jgi:membrane-bound lytic murein transglycosylase A
LTIVLLASQLRKKSGRDVVSVQMRVDGLDVRIYRSRGLIVVAMAWLVGTGCMAAHSASIDPLKLPDTQLEPVEWADLSGWSADDHAVAFATFLASCKPFLNVGRPRDPRPIYEGLLQACRRAVATKIAGAADTRKFFEENFRPVRIARLGKSTGLLTGYYEPIVDGSRFPNPEFHWPLYRRPRDLLVNGKKPAAASIPNRAAVGRLNANKQVVPYYDRLAVENGALDGQHLEICWLKDPFEAMSIEIQGSVRVRLEDGTLVRLSYDAHNGYNYTSIGRILIQRNLLRRDEMSTDRIKRWMLANPELAKEVRGTNKSFVFFRISGLNNQDEPAGAQGVRLTPGRSIAVDTTHVYGTPFFIEAELPLENGRADARFHRLMVAQDTGSAIVGPARADIYWGAGDAAGRIAGRIRQQGRFAILLPRELDMVAAGRAMPLPQPKPPIQLETVAKKGEGERAHGYPKDGVKPQREQGALISHSQKVGDRKKSLIKLGPQTQPAKPPLNKKGEFAERGLSPAQR